MFVCFKALSTATCKDKQNYIMTSPDPQILCSGDMAVYCLEGEEHSTNTLLPSCSYKEVLFYVSNLRLVFVVCFKALSTAHAYAYGQAELYYDKGL